LHFRDENGLCEYSGIAAEYNYCVKAHGSDELEEWNHRVRYRQAKLAISQKNTSVISAYQNVTEFCSEISGAEVTCDQPLDAHLTDKTASCMWNFHIQV